jgi:hypothetical protein
MSEPAGTVLDIPQIISEAPSAVPGTVVLGVMTGAADVIDPEIGNFSPPNGTALESNDPIFFDVTDNSGLFRRVVVLVLQGGRWEAAFDGDELLEPYLSSSVTNIAGGFRFELRRDQEWDGAVTVRVIAIDQSGNEA